MKDFLAELVRTSTNSAQGRNVAREYLQARILACSSRAAPWCRLPFTAAQRCEFLYASPRYSEDMDFALERAREQYDFRAYLHAIRGELVAEGYNVELKVSDQKVVHGAFVRFPGLLYALGLSPHPSEVLAVELEVDTSPPTGADFVTTVVRRYITVQIQHHDRASLLAGKLHAILQRPLPQGTRCL